MTGEEKFKFFSHTECEYFPCHSNADESDFNCLFCYCPLYALGEDCGGQYNYLENGTKDCSRCLIPHRRSGYEYINSKYKQIAELASRKGK